jgi:hypothetical protein
VSDPCQSGNILIETMATGKVEHCMPRMYHFRILVVCRMVVRELVTYGELSYFSCSEDWSFGDWSFGDWSFGEWTVDHSLILK